MSLVWSSMNTSMQLLYNNYLQQQPYVGTMHVMAADLGWQCKCYCQQQTQHNGLCKRLLQTLLNPDWLDKSSGRASATYCRFVFPGRSYAYMSFYLLKTRLTTVLYLLTKAPVPSYIFEYS